jgi:cobalt/nickel transport system ATP-binding protein
MNDGVICLEGIACHYGRGPRVLDGVDLSVGRGERVALCGANGSGKTTLLHVAVGLIRPDAGAIRLFGRACVREDDFRAARLKAGLLFENPDDMLFSTTVEEDMAFGPFNLGWSRERVGVAVCAALERVGLTGYDRRLTTDLSRGEKQLVALASLLAMEPEVLILDEPTGGRDDAALERVARILTEPGLTILLVSHDRGFMDRVTTRRVWLQAGRVHSAPPRRGAVGEGGARRGGD